MDLVQGLLGLVEVLQLADTLDGDPVQFGLGLLDLGFDRRLAHRVGGGGGQLVVGDLELLGQRVLHGLALLVLQLLLRGGLGRFGRGLRGVGVVALGGQGLDRVLVLLGAVLGDVNLVRLAHAVLVFEGPAVGAVDHVPGEDRPLGHLVGGEGGELLHQLVDEVHSAGAERLEGLPHLVQLVTRVTGTQSLGRLLGGGFLQLLQLLLHLVELGGLLRVDLVGLRVGVEEQGGSRTRGERRKELARVRRGEGLRGELGVLVHRVQHDDGVIRVVPLGNAGRHQLDPVENALDARDLGRVDDGGLVDAKLVEQGVHDKSRNLPRMGR